MRHSKNHRPGHRVLLALLIAALMALSAGGSLAWAQEEEGQTNENRDLFANFLHFAVLGKFELADDFAKKLIANDPDPLEVLQFADQHTNSLKTLIFLVSKAEVSDSAKAVMKIIQEGERMRRQDPNRIKLNIEKLGGDPQTEFNAVNRLRDSGEYAIPWLIAALQDKAQSKLHTRIIRMLPKMGKDAVNPLVIALSMNDLEAKQFVARALGEIGYPQALPYLRAVLQDPKAPPELKEIVSSAILNITQSSTAISDSTACEGFLDLARQYYSGRGSVQADPRMDFANVWYWTDGQLRRIEVPREIFDEIMAMRCCEQTLRLMLRNDEAVALWLAANIRREAELGMNVESVDPAEAVAADPTKVENFPRSTYFARAAGARYCHMVLDIALQHREPAVALGAIAALRLVAGETNLIGSEDYKQPLAQALTFPDMVVRMKAALALAQALPATSFTGADGVVPILAEALAQKGKQYVLAIEPDEANLNRVMNALRDDQTTVIGDAQLFTGLERARSEVPTITAVFLATDVTGPELESAVTVLRNNHLYAMTPIVLLSKPGQMDQAEALVKGDAGVASVVASADMEALQKAWKQAALAVGQIRLQPDEALALALDAVEWLRKIAFSRSTVFDFSLAENALIGALSSPEEALQTSAASVLALSSTSAAQQKIAALALEGNNSESLRVSAFGSLAESAKVNGNLLTEELIDQLIDLAINEPNLTLRSAASQALGALDLPSNKAGQIISKYHRG